MKRFIFSGVYIISFVFCVAKTSGDNELLKRYIEEGKASADAVQVSDSALIFTGMIKPSNHARSINSQCVSVFDELNAQLVKAGGDLSHVVRLNCYYSKDLELKLFQAELKKRFLNELPAVSYIFIQDSNESSMIACEAVAVSKQNVSQVVRLNDHVSILPKGSKIFVSGQAEKAPDVVTSVHLTMNGLMKSLTYLGLKPENCVQLKAFVKPGLDKELINHEIISFFEGTPPPVVLIDWIGDYNAEIEMVVSDPKNVENTESVFYGYFPWLHKSPRYSSYVCVKAGAPLIFISQIESDPTVSSGEQLTRVFEGLGTVLFKSASSYRSLVKATYYLGDLKLRSALSDIRGVYYDPIRAPSASAIGVKSFELPGITFGVDVVAVPASL